MSFRKLILASMPLLAAVPPHSAFSQTLAAPYSFRVNVSGHGAPLVLILDLMADGAVWDDMVARYRDRYEMHVLTLPGFAGVPPLASGTLLLTTVREEIARYIHEKNLKQPIVVGHSLGGFLAFSVAAHNPELVGRIIAVDGVPFLSALMDPSATASSARPMAEQMRTIYRGTFGRSAGGAVTDCTRGHDARHRTGYRGHHMGRTL